MKLPKKFPRIYRFITESKQFKKARSGSIRLLNQPKVKKSIFIVSASLILFLMVVTVYGVGVSSLVFHRRLTQAIELVNKREKLMSEANFWGSIAQKYDGYKDAYFEVALLEYKLSDYNQARFYNNKTLLLDPNDKNAKNLEKILDTK